MHLPKILGTRDGMEYVENVRSVWPSPLLRTAWPSSPAVLEEMGAI